MNSYTWAFVWARLGRVWPRTITVTTVASLHVYVMRAGTARVLRCVKSMRFTACEETDDSAKPDVKEAALT